jgi:hypothetical protein
VNQLCGGRSLKYVDLGQAFDLPIKLATAPDQGGQLIDPEQY